MIIQEYKDQIEKQGVTIEAVERQLNNFATGFPSIKLVAPATKSKGINVLNEYETGRMVSVFENALSSGLVALKFVPASGAASRMFKNLYAYLEKATTKEEADAIAESDSFMKTFFDNISRFAFYADLSKLVQDKDDKREWVSKILSEQGLGYGQKPKGQLAFHKYGESSRTPFEEHLIEAAAYCAGTTGTANVHFTVSPEHQKGFESILQNVKTLYQRRLGVKFNVGFSHQKKTTDTIAADENNDPFLDKDGKLVFRPGGHGALIENLNELDADVIFIKNIDNVVPDHLKSETKKFKKVLAGVLISCRNKVYAYAEKFSKPDAWKNKELMTSAEAFLRKELCIEFSTEFDSEEQKAEYIKQKLNRPIRVCGMVKNQGEPGGGPFWAVNADGSVSLQIVEKAQIDTANEEQNGILEQSTYFNPVDIVCSTKNYKGERFDLTEYIDHQTSFISQKTLDGKVLKALELPGLWNGAMSDWITLFVEVPVITFNPVKTVNDLLRPEHQ